MSDCKELEQSEVAAMVPDVSDSTDQPCLLKKHVLLKRYATIMQWDAWILKIQVRWV